MTLRPLLLIFTILPLIAGAADAPAQVVDPVLTLRGAGGSGEARTFSMTDLEALGTVEIVTKTPWNERPSRFFGIPLRRLLELGGPGKTQLTVIALNDYSATLPAEQVRRYPIILATRRDGERMEIRNKGPLWVIYPLDAHPELDIPANHARMVWQVTALNLQ